MDINTLQKAIDEGKLKQVPVAYLSCAGWGMLHGVLELMLAQHYHGKIQDWNHFFAFVEEMLLKGLVKEDSDSRKEKEER